MDFRQFDGVGVQGCWMSQHFNTALLLCSVGNKEKALGHVVSEQLLQYIQTEINEQAHGVSVRCKGFVHKSIGK